MIILKVLQTTMPPTTINSEAIQQSQKFKETLLDHLLESIMGFPTDSEAKQALTSAGI